MEGDEDIVYFSVQVVMLVNDGQARHKASLFVQNRCSAPRKVRVAVSKESDPVSGRSCSRPVEGSTPNNSCACPGASERL